MQEVRGQIEINENKPLGVLGALLGALAGGLVYVLLDKVGYVAVISGTMAIAAALFGYEKLAGKQSTFGVIVSIVASLVVTVVAWYACYLWDVYDAYKAQILNFNMLLESAAYLFKTYSDIRSSYLLNLVLSLVFCGIGIFSLGISALKGTRSGATTTKQVLNDQPAGPVENSRPQTVEEVLESADIVNDNESDVQK